MITRRGLRAWLRWLAACVGVAFASAGLTAVGAMPAPASYQPEGEVWYQGAVWAVAFGAALTGWSAGKLLAESCSDALAGYPHPAWSTRTKGSGVQAAGTRDCAGDHAPR